MAGAIKISRFPYGFFEKEMWSYFSQFGRVQRLKLFRSRKTGNSKGFAFVQFAYESVAKIVAETMNNYLMFDKLMKCEFIPESKILPAMFKNWQRVMIPRLGEMRHTKKVNAPKDEYHEAKARCRLYTKLVKRNEKCRNLGIDYQFKIPPMPGGKPNLKLLALKSEIKSESGENRQPENEKSIVSQLSAYSFIIDSSDDEIEMKTPPKSVKKRKLSKDQTPSEAENESDVILVKDEPLSGDDEDEDTAKRNAFAAADFIKLSSSKIKKDEPASKKKKKGKKSDDGEVKKIRKVKRYFNAANA